MLKTKICELCHNNYNKRGIKFCSIQCWNKFQKGKEKPKLKGVGIKPLKKFICKKCNRIWYNKRWKKQKFCTVSCSSKYNINKKNLHTFDIRKKISATLQGINIEEWKDFSQPEIIRLRDSKEYNEWRKSIYKKDNYTCRICKVRGGTLHAHHILKFSKFKDERFDLNNGVTLCINCHMKVTQLEKKGEKYDF